MSDPKSASNEPASQVLTFWLGNEVFGIDIRAVREIIQCGPMATVPLMPTFVRGVINLRGSVVPVVDLHARFGRPPAVLGKKSCIVIFDAQREGERVELGLLVDAVSAVMRMAADDIEAAPDFGNTVRREFIRGIGKTGSRFVILLDPDRALDVQDMATLCERSQEALAA